MEKLNDSSKSRDTSSSMNSSIDYLTPIRTQRDLEYYYPAALGGDSRLSSQNSSTFPPKSSTCNSVYLTPPSSSSSSSKEDKYQITTEDRSTGGSGEPSINNNLLVPSHSNRLTGIMVGHGSTGFAFLNPDTIVGCADGLETGHTYWHDPQTNIWNSVPYTIWDSQKVFRLGIGENRIVAICAGGTFWYRSIVDQLRERIEVLGQILLPEFCADFAHGYMNAEDTELPELPPWVNLRDEYCEIMFGGFIDATGDITRPEIERASSPSLFYADHARVYEINAMNRIFTEQELLNRDDWNFGTVGSGSDAAETVLLRCEQFLVMEGLSWQSHHLRALAAMRAAVIEDIDTDGIISVGHLTRADFQVEHYDSRPDIAAGNLTVLGAAINQLLLDKIEDGSVRIKEYRTKYMTTGRKAVKINKFIKRTVSLEME